jgi:hypothetical protein
MSFSNRNSSLKRATQQVAERRAVNETRKAATMLALMTPQPVIRPVSYSANQPTFKPLRAVPKSPRARNPALLAMARGKPCLLLSPICKPDPETTVACHGAGIENGKGMGYKVSDGNTVCGCTACNHYTDAYKGATAEQKKAVFEAGFMRQLEAWRELAAGAKTKPAEKKAAQWALDQHALAIQRNEAKNV